MIIKTIHTLSAQQATAAQREWTAIIALPNNDDSSGENRQCMAAIHEGTNSIIQNTTQAHARNSNAQQDANDNDNGDNTQQQPIQMQSNTQNNNPHNIHLPLPPPLQQQLLLSCTLLTLAHPAAETGGIMTEMFLLDDASRCSQSKHRSTTTTRTCKRR